MGLARANGMPKFYPRGAEPSITMTTELSANTVTHH